MHATHQMLMADVYILQPNKSSDALKVGITVAHAARIETIQYFLEKTNFKSN